LVAGLAHVALTAIRGQNAPTKAGRVLDEDQRRLELLWEGPGRPNRCRLGTGTEVRRLSAGGRWIRTHGPTMKGADFEPRLAPTIAIARDGSLCFRHLSPAIRGTVSSNPACSSGESAANLTTATPYPSQVPYHGVWPGLRLLL
jgi:hypothetical protein